MNGALSVQAVESPRPKRLALEKLLHAPSAPVSRSLSAVARHFGVTFAELLGRDRHSRIANARHVVAWLLRQHGLSYPEIGRALGGRDHTTAMNSVRAIEEAVADHAGVAATMQELLACFSEDHGPDLHLVPGEGALLDQRRFRGTIELDQPIAMGESIGPIASSESNTENGCP